MHRIAILRIYFHRSTMGCSQIGCRNGLLIAHRNVSGQFDRIASPHDQKLAKKVDQWVAAGVSKNRSSLIEGTTLIKALGQAKDISRVWKTYDAIRRVRAPDLPLCSVVLQAWLADAAGLFVLGSQNMWRYCIY